ncbi:uncharacterized protein involved in exopolysaccharide biosynthesis [Rhizomicrobium palustre]|uniref:Uncharacterized protein involved in exopolysaccharide biosynthesis n=1 Tax=Rhizomicrobium palustre TaxID=189966 RepID=A0A846MYI5_9PROT|nr:GumC family protein [Rhizomicrobium palustre]NIK88027.1 uncharacterized protein involved in exopolysaccharide biosynthesis [Rhizomicrobium palustre]
MNARLVLPVPPPEAATRAFRVAEIWQVAERHFQLILLTTLAVVALATVYVLQVRPQYAATSEVMLDPRKSAVENSAAVLSSLSVDQPTILNQIEVLTSHRLAGKVVDQFHLERDPEFAAPGLAAKLFSPAIEPRETAIDKLRKNLKVAQAGFSSTIRITVTSSDRAKATQLASGIAALYVQEQLETKADAARNANIWLTQRVSELAAKVKEAEAAVQKYKAEHNISFTAGGTSVQEQQLAELNAQLTVARTDYDDKAAKAARTAALLRSGGLASAPQVLSSPVIASLRAQQAELAREIANLAAKYGPNHPKMKELAAQRADLDGKIAQETARIADGVRNEADTAGSHVGSLQKSLRQLEDANAKKNQDSVELTALQSAAASARAMYQAFLTQYSQTENQQGILRPDVFVISASDVEEAFGPQTKLLAILSAIPAGLLLGLALAFMRDRREPELPVQPAPAPSMRRAEAPAAILPEMGPRAADLVLAHPASPYAVAVANLLAGIIKKATPPLVIAVTAAAPGSGKTTLALSLARAAAQSGIATIAIDANRSAYHLGLMAGQVASAGHSGYGIEGFINPDRLSPALIMAPNGQISSYERILAQPLLTGMLDSLKTSLELMIIAAPPLNDPSTASILALSDLAIVAIDGRAPRPMPAGLPGTRILTVFTHHR